MVLMFILKMFGGLVVADKHLKFNYKKAVSKIIFDTAFFSPVGKFFLYTFFPIFAIVL